jgi:putative chitinase
MPRLSQEKAAAYLPDLTAACAEFRINNELRIAAFLATLGIESAELTRWVENLNYSPGRLVQVWPNRFPTIAAAAPYAHNPKALAIKTYGSRLGNRAGTEDGWNFIGRAPIQATGREMYDEVGDMLGLDLVNDPELLLDKSIAFRASAAIFARIKNCNPLADGVIADPSNLKRIRKRINGGYHGLAEFLMYYKRARAVLPDSLVLRGGDIVIDVEAKVTDAEPELELGIPVLEESASTAAGDPAGSLGSPQSEPSSHTVEPGAEVGAGSPVPSPAPTDPPAPPENVELSTSHVVEAPDGSTVKDQSTLSAPAADAPGLMDKVNNLGDRFQGLQGTLDKFGISNPLANTSIGTYLLTFGKYILAAVIAVWGMVYEHPEYLIVTVILAGIAAFIYHQSRKRVDGQRAGVPVEIVEKIIDKSSAG